VEGINPRSVDFAPDGTTLLVGDAGGAVLLLDSVTAQTLLRLGIHSGETGAVAFSPAGDRFATGGADGAVTVWDTATRTRVVRVEGGPGAVRGLAWSPDGTQIAAGIAGADAGRLVVWDLPGGSEAASLPQTGPVTALAWAPEGSPVAVGLADGAINLWEPASGALRFFQPPAETGAVRALAFGPEGALLLVDGAGLARIVQIDSGALLHVIGAPDDPVVAIDWPGGAAPLTAGDASGVTVWDVYIPPRPEGSGEQAVLSIGPVQTLTGHAAPLLGFGFQDADTTLLGGAADGRAVAWTLGSPDANVTAQAVRGPYNSIDALALAPGASLAAAALPDGRIAIYDPLDPAEERIFEGHTAPVNALQFAPGGVALASASDDGTLVLWDVEAGTPFNTLTYDGPLTALAYAQNGILVASGGADGSVLIRDTLNGNELRRFETAGGAVSALALSPDGALIAIGEAAGGRLRVYETGSGALVAELPGHSAAVRALAFSADSRYLASGGEDAAVLLWGVRPASLLARLPVSGVAAGVVAFSSDGRWLAAGLSSGVVTAWELGE